MSNRPIPEPKTFVSREEFCALLKSAPKYESGRLRDAANGVKKLVKYLEKHQAFRYSQLGLGGTQCDKLCVDFKEYSSKHLKYASSSESFLYPVLVRLREGRTDDPVLALVWQPSGKINAPRESDLNEEDVENLYRTIAPLDHALPIKEAESTHQVQLNHARGEEPTNFEYLPIKLGRFPDLKVHRIAGGEDSDFRMEDIHFKYEESTRAFPSDLETTRLALLEAARQKAHANGASFVDNPTVYMRHCRFCNEENSELEITFSPSSYFLHAPFMNRLDQQLVGGTSTIRQAYFRDPESTLVSGASSALLNFITDGGKKILFTRRGKHVAVASNRVAETMCGTINPIKDRDPVTGTPSPFRAAAREAEEELGIRVSPRDIRFRLIVIGMDEPSVGFLGDIEVDQTAETVINRACMARQREASNFYAVDFDPQSVSTFLKSKNDNIAPVGLATIIASLLYRFGWDEVDKAFR